MFREKTIVIIDDSEDDLLFAEYLLKQGGYGEIIKTFSLDEGIKAVKKHGAQVVILDLMGLSGARDEPTAAHERLQEECPNVQIIVLSGNKNPEVSKKVKESGSSFILKQEALQVPDTNTSDMGTLVKLMSETLPSKTIESQIIFLNSRLNRLEDYLPRLHRLEDYLMDSLASGNKSNLIPEIAALKERIKFLEERGQEIVVLREKCSTFESHIVVITGNSSEDRETLSQLRNDLRDVSGGMHQLELQLTSAQSKADKLNIDEILEQSERYKKLFKFFRDAADFKRKSQKFILDNATKELIGLGVLAFAGASSPQWLPWVKAFGKIILGVDE